MQRVNEYIQYEIYPKGVKAEIVESDIKLSGVKHIYPISKPNGKLLNGFIKKIGHLPKECDFKTQFVIYFIDYENAPSNIPSYEDKDF